MMATIDEINDPEWRWQHKEEMSKIMPFQSERIRLGIIVINYTKLRQNYLSTIKESISHNLDWDRFKYLIDIVPYNLHKKTSEGLEKYECRSGRGIKV